MALAASSAEPPPMPITASMFGAAAPGGDLGIDELRRRLAGHPDMLPGETAGLERGEQALARVAIRRKTRCPVTSSRFLP